MARKRKVPPIPFAPEPEPPVPSEEEILGRNLAAAYIATQNGIGVDWAKKMYVHGQVGAFWMSVARMVIDQIGQHLPMPPRPPRKSGAAKT